MKNFIIINRGWGPHRRERVLDSVPKEHRIYYVGCQETQDILRRVEGYRDPCNEENRVEDSGFDSWFLHH